MTFCYSRPNGLRQHMNPQKKEKRGKKKKIHWRKRPLELDS